MGRPERAGLAYFAAVFATGFLFGTVRVLFVEGLIGTELAVAAELPAMLAVSWLAARFLVVRVRVGDAPAARLRMGFAALCLLVLAETVLGVALFGQTVGQHFADYATLRGALTLIGQAGFGLMPLFVARRRNDEGHKNQNTKGEAHVHQEIRTDRRVRSRADGRAGHGG
ncbi:hypothetical protein FY036_12885 [Mesorhizobium microcysteis]|uniref:Uncharacterized protein n=1 Tax=Neoaquamicrobium microcysteis TaxID=2682781 RepID=A0A5D4GZJ9_9HYPH|nr:hypothetical protein [Mesorhizobium microcysteis]TYR31980.1 hypothetical protein FY036_12885 [Mesorhizobium microcysteis]